MNRYLMHWSWPGPVLYTGLVAAVGLVLSGLGLAVRWWRPALAHRLVLPAGLFVIGVFVRQSLFYDWKNASNLLLNAVAVLVVLGVLVELGRRLRWTAAKLRAALVKVSLFFVPVVPIVWITAFSFPRYPLPPTPSLDDARRVPAAEGRQPTDNVYLFVFDAWSYRMTLDEGEVWPHLPHLRQGSERMCVFTDAHSPGCHTVTSLPRLIFQRSDAYVPLRGERIGFWDGAFHDTRELPSLFTRAREQGYRTYMIGFYHPYHAMLGNSVDLVRTVPETAAFGEGAWPLTQAMFAEWTARLLGPRLAYYTVGTMPSQRNRRFVYFTQTVLDYVHAVLDDPRPSGQFAMFHVPLPHCPFCFGPDGLGPLSETYNSASADLLRNQLQYTDQVIGKILEQLEARGKGQNSTIILTSDHTWREDPMLPRKARDWTHVPLFIRLPGQQESVRVEAPFSTVHLGRLLETAREPGFSPEAMPSMISSSDWYVPVPDREIKPKHPRTRWPCGY